MADTYVGLARHDEFGNQEGGVPGDQLQENVPDSNGEVCLIPLADFLDSGSCVIYRLKDVDKANKTGEGIVKACNNHYIGYDTSNRLSIMAYGVYSGKNGKGAECDNTSLARVVIKYGTGIDIGDFNNKNVHLYLDMSDMFGSAIPYSENEKVYIGDVLVKSDGNIVGIIGYGEARVKPADKGTTDYNDLENKPSINGETVEGDKTQDDYHITGGGSKPTVEGEVMIFK